MDRAIQAHFYACSAEKKVNLLAILLLELYDNAARYVSNFLFLYLLLCTFLSLPILNSFFSSLPFSPPFLIFVLYSCSSPINILSSSTDTAHNYPQSRIYSPDTTSFTNRQPPATLRVCVLWCRASKHVNIGSCLRLNLLEGT